MTRNLLKAPDSPVLMHSCCAPCAGELMEAMVESKIPFAIYFYNPNIHPLKEYEIRKNENIRYAEKMNIPFIDADYDADRWFEKTEGLEDSPERGERCTLCFDIRFERTAEYAKREGYPVITSSLGISRWKNMQQINDCGVKAAKRHDVEYWTYNWRKGGGGARMYEIAKREEFYKQEYCGCIYSLRDSNKWRKQNNRSLIQIGQEYYTKLEEK
ncbi:MAG: Epoxyqueuosine reductase QueH [Chlamydiae bacterium]|nr:Epoxyqueuosine reductase QueH [Chlamydiota bacterium]